jgi:geranylgeranylglycerol-phosphate geranylgeranyltransferase
MRAEYNAVQLEPPHRRNDYRRVISSSDVHPLGQLLRIGNVLVSFAGTLIGGLDAHGNPFSVTFPLWGVLLLAGTSTACVTAGGNVLNDIIDRETDLVNHPDRPLVTGAISVATARRLATGLLTASWIVILPIVGGAPFLAVILAIAIGGLLTYEFRFKAEGFAGNLLVAFLTGAVFLFGGAAVGRLLAVVPFALMAFLATLRREVIKDMEDATGDLDRRTLPRTRGMRVSGLVARISAALAILLSPIPIFTFLSGLSGAGIMYLALVVAADALFAISVVWLPRRLHQEQTISKGAMTVALAAFLAAAFR